MYFDDCLKEDTEADTENTSLKIQMAMSGVKEIWWQLHWTYNWKIDK